VATNPAVDLTGTTQNVRELGASGTTSGTTGEKVLLTWGGTTWGPPGTTPLGKGATVGPYLWGPLVPAPTRGAGSEPDQGEIEEQKLVPWPNLNRSPGDGADLAQHGAGAGQTSRYAPKSASFGAILPAKPQVRALCLS
jgi:hypothetical protein